MSHRALVGLIVALVASSSTVAVGGSIRFRTDRPRECHPGKSHRRWRLVCRRPRLLPRRVTITAQVLDVAPQSPVTQGTLEWQVCSSPRGGFPKEVCDADNGPARWSAAALSFLDFDPLTSLITWLTRPDLGFRLHFSPVPGGAYKRTTSASFNLDRTCSPSP